MLGLPQSHAQILIFHKAPGLRPYWSAAGSAQSSKASCRVDSTSAESVLTCVGVPALWWAVQPCLVPHLSFPSQGLVLLSLHRVQRVWVQAGGSLTLALSTLPYLPLSPLTDSAPVKALCFLKIFRTGWFSLCLTPVCGYVGEVTVSVSN